MKALFSRKQLTFGDTKTIEALRKKRVFDKYERRKQEGIEASFFHADTQWKQAAAQRVFWLAQHRYEFTADDVTEFLNEQGITTGNSSALGAIMQAAQRLGIITNTGHFRESRRPVTHGAPVRIWHSNLYRKRGRK